MKPVLCGLAESVYTRIARLALEEKSVSYQFESVDIFSEEGIPASYLKRHPFGRIPCLVDGDFVLYETSAITRYIDEVYAGPKLQPGDAVQRARVNQIISMLDAYAYRPMIWDVFVERVVKPLEGEKPNEQTIAQALSVTETCLGELAKQLADRKFLVGENLTLADLHTAPMLAYFVETPEGNHLMSKHPGLSQWLRHIQETESFIVTRSKYA